MTRLDGERQQQQPGLRGAHLAPDVRQVRVAEEQRQQAGGAGENRGGPQVGAHRGTAGTPGRQDGGRRRAGFAGLYYRAKATVYGQA